MGGQIGSFLSELKAWHYRAPPSVLPPTREKNSTLVPIAPFLREGVIQNEAFTLLVEPEDEDGRVSHNRGYPMVAVTRENCGYSVFYDAVQMGIMEMKGS